MKTYLMTFVLVAGPLAAFAQQAPAPAPDTQSSHSTAQSEAGEPRATTSPDAVPPSAPPSSAAQPASPAAAAAQPEAAPTSRTQRGQPATGNGAKPPAANGGKAGVDRLDLGTATVTGDREQPKVMYIVPWKKSDIGDLSGKPMNSLLDEALSPVDRDEFKRQVVYYQAVRADASQNGAKASAQQGEK
jgi:hypothetical protein